MGQAKMKLTSTMAELTLLLMKLDVAWMPTLQTPLTFYLLFDKPDKVAWQWEMQQHLHSAKD